jgi:hypothetical protein
MTPDEVKSAMQLAGRSPEAARTHTDLGRFGLGLKTASLSQCRTLTVVSRKAGKSCGYTWSLDHLANVRRWALIELSDDEIAQLPRAAELLTAEHGTMVLWRDLDFLVDARGTTQKSLDEALVDARNHLALVFHRYLDGEHGRTFSIRLNGKTPEKMDPFLRTRLGTQRGPTEQFDIEEQVVSVQPYTLPFLNRLTEADRRRAGITTTLRDSQGFYIYRQRRLVIWGTWFGIVPKDGFGRLARVQVDMPNTLDHLWALDIKKSAAVPPPAVRTQLRRIADRIVEPSRTAFRFRGRAAITDSITRVWSLIEDRDGFRYIINRGHPLIKAIGTELGPSVASNLGRALELIEDSFPIYDAYNRLGEDRSPTIGEPNEDRVSRYAKQIWDIEKAQGMTAEQFVAQLQDAEPFCSASDPVAILTKVTER